MSEPTGPSSSDLLGDDEMRYLSFLCGRIHLAKAEVLDHILALSERYGFDAQELAFLHRQVIFAEKKRAQPPVGSGPLYFASAAKARFIDRAIGWVVATRQIGTLKVCPRCLSSFGNRKTAFPTREDALQIADDVQRRFNTVQRPYLCPHGYGFHLTSTPLR
jgi:hypothetical protein